MQQEHENLEPQAVGIEENTIRFDDSNLYENKRFFD